MTLNKSELIQKISEYDLSENEVVLTLDEFFYGNEDPGSIGVNIPDQPSPQVFYQTFKLLLDNPKVDKILARIVEIGEPEDWFYSDTIYVIGDITIEELESSIAHLSFDEIYNEWMYGTPVNISEADKTKNVFSIWWD